MTEVRNIYLSANFIQNSPQIKSTLETIDLYNIPWVDNTMGYPYESGGYHYVEGAFNNCYSLTSVTNINENIIDMGEAFRNCSSMIEPPIIPNNVLTMGRTFCDCSSLKNTPDMNNIYELYSLVDCFYGCTSLEHISNLPHAVKQLDGAFAGCSNLKTFDSFPDNIFTIYDNGTYYLYSTTMISTFQDCSSLVNSPSLPPRVNDMTGTFTNCISLETAPNIPNSVQNMQGCFYGCTSLVNAPVIPNNVTDLSFGFYGCTSLVTAPDMSNATSITDMTQSFTYCNGLTTVLNIPNNVSDMNQTFYGCSSLVNVSSIPNSVENMFGSFAECTSLVTAPDMSNATSVTNMDYTFFDCQQLSNNIYIPNNVTNMYVTFVNCYSLSGDIIIESDKIVNITGAFLFLDSSGNPITSGYPDRNVYIPFNYSNDAPTTTYTTLTTYGYSPTSRFFDGVQLFDLATYVSPNRTITFTFVNDSTNDEFSGSHFYLTFKKDNVTVNTTEIQSGNSVVVGDADTVIIYPVNDEMYPATPITSTYSLSGYTNGSTITVPCQRNGSDMSY